MEAILTVSAQHPFVRQGNEYRRLRLLEIEEGVEGLVHVSEMDWTNKNVNLKVTCR
ncbi:MAG: hypothetical protein R3F24_11840 [Gammaproteobacteria bacterium]